ncbi:hypothetical protein CBER1_03045 [Cercospora berteroae]|uniref:Uncharacterized protein n=1 Tax=Cercospora berteroae TaxID=357750 RepID=A0A2S6CHC6_9PEZI|nr:hypothetical protein CBER1_03045 [Cercospora berteroae]
MSAEMDPFAAVNYRCTYCMREWFDPTRARCEGCVPEFPLGDFDFDQAAAPMQPPMQWQNFPAVNGNYFSGASDFNAPTTPSWTENQQVNAPTVQGVNFQGHSALANLTEPPPVNAQQEATVAPAGDNAAGFSGSFSEPDAEASGFPARPQTAETFFGEGDVAQVNAQHFAAGQWGEYGHQWVGPLATPIAAAPAQATNGATTRAPRRTFAQKTPEEQTRQRQKSKYQQRSQHMAKQITKLCRCNRDMHRDKKRIANSKKAVQDWAPQYGLSWKVADNFFELAVHSRPVAAAHMQAAQDWVAQGGDRKLWKTPQLHGDADLKKLPFAWVTNAHGLGGRPFG